MEEEIIDDCVVSLLFCYSLLAYPDEKLRLFYNWWWYIIIHILRSSAFMRLIIYIDLSQLYKPCFWQQKKNKDFFSFSSCRTSPQTLWIQNQAVLLGLWVLGPICRTILMFLIRYNKGRFLLHFLVHDLYQIGLSSNPRRFIFWHNI